jgi:hypothetical protein
MSKPGFRKKLHSNIDGKVQADKRSSGFQGNVDVKEREVVTDPETGRNLKVSFFGAVSPLTGQVDLQYNPRYETRHPDKTQEVVVGIGRHEFNHIHDRRVKFGGCPRELETHLKLYDIIKEVLFQRGLGPREVQYMANVFEDYVDNLSMSRSFDLEGMVRFYEDVGKSCSNGYSDFYEAFVKLQMMHLPNRYKHMIRGYYRHRPMVKEVIDGFMTRSGLSKYKLEVERKEVRDSEAMIRYLTSEQHWPELARIFAEEFSKVMQKGFALPIPSLAGNASMGKGQALGDQSQGESGEQQKDVEGKGQQGEDEAQGSGEGKEDKNAKPQGIDFDELKGGNKFDQDMKNPETRKELANRRYQDGKGIPEWISYYEALDGVYQRLARHLNIRGHVQTHTDRMPLSWFGDRPYDPKKDRASNVFFGFDKHGELRLKKRRYHIDTDLEYKIAQQGFPDMRYGIMDTSYSMLEDPQGGRNVGSKLFIPWGDNSKYHFALLAFWGLVEYLARNHLLKRATIGLSNFSDSTHYAKGLQAAKRLALTPQFGGTRLELQSLQELFSGQGSFILSLSDGAVQNWGQICDKYIELASRHYYFHMQIGRPNSMTSSLEAAGFKVVYVNSGIDIPRNAIDLADGMRKQIIERKKAINLL